MSLSHFGFQIHVQITLQKYINHHRVKNIAKQLLYSLMINHCKVENLCHPNRYTFCKTSY